MNKQNISCELSHQSAQTATSSSVSIKDLPKGENGLTKISEAKIRQQVEDFRIARSHNDTATADADFFAPVLDWWLSSIRLNADSQLINTMERDQAIIRLGIAMHEYLSMRDAIIISILTNLNFDDLLEIGVDPHNSQTVNLVNTTLDSVFHSDSAEPNNNIYQNAIDIFLEMKIRLPENYSVQALAVMSYMLWWLQRDDEAEGAAVSALKIDSECTLASIVISALKYGIAPAWKK